MFSRAVQSDSTDDVLFREVQRFKDTLVWPLIVVPIVAACVYVLYVVARTLIFHGGDGPGMVTAAAVLGVAFYTIKGFAWLAILCYAARLEVEVRHDGLYLRLLPFQFKPRHVPWSEIERADITSYRVFSRPGGRGYLRGRQWRAWTVRGNEGVQLVTRDGRRLLIGSQAPQQLAAAIYSLGRMNPGE